MALRRRRSIDPLKGTLRPQQAIEQVKLLWPDFEKQHKHVEYLKTWISGEGTEFVTPTGLEVEFAELQKMSYTPWLGLVVTSTAQSLYVEGHRLPDGKDNSVAWLKYWQRNGMDRRQIAVHRAAVGPGASYIVALKGEIPLTHEKGVVLRGVSSANMIAFYDDMSYEDYPTWALEARLQTFIDPDNGNETKAWSIFLYDDQAVYVLEINEDGDPSSIVFVETRNVHNLGFCPVHRYTNQIDLEGNVIGDVEPFIPVAARIDQDMYDRLVIQRFASWKIRTIAGMKEPAGADEAALAERLLRATDILISDNPETKFGTLDATGLADFINARDADIRDLAAVSQTPPHHLLGLVPNMGAEALASAESALMRKIEERKHNFGETHEQLLRTCKIIDGEEITDADFENQVVWRDVESRSLNQVADALGKMAIQLQIPVEMLWQRVPGWTRTDTEEAKALIEKERARQELIAMQDFMLGTDAGTGGGPAAGGVSTNPSQQPGAKKNEQSTVTV